MRQQTLEERKWERLVAVMAKEGWSLARGTASRFDAPRPGRLVQQNWVCKWITMGAIAFLSRKSR